MSRVLTALAPWRNARPGAAMAAGSRNMLLLIQLRWLAVAGQVVTILVVHFLMHIRLPLGPMLLAAGALCAVNLAGLLGLRRKSGPLEGELFVALLFDVAVLTWQLYLSGGAANPFAPLFLLQVVLGAVLLKPFQSWIMVALTTACFVVLMKLHRPLDLPVQLTGNQLSLDLEGRLACFILIGILLVLFVSRITSNLRARDSHVAQMRQRAAEEDHIVRMGLLASGAAHELGTPLASLSVILSDWRRMPVFTSDAELSQDLVEMQSEVERCKAIVTGILLSAGEARGEAPVVTDLRAVMADILTDWRAAHPAVHIDYVDCIGDDLAVISDPALKQVIVNVLDNATEAGAETISILADLGEEAFVITIQDDGAGFAPEILNRFGQPYQSTKARPGAGLGLFLLVNVMRKLGGEVAASNRPGRGARIVVTLPLSAIAVTEDDPS